eukprot:9792092-Prorocentrum_lima.AAC.1
MREVAQRVAWRGAPASSGERSGRVGAHGRKYGFQCQPHARRPSWGSQGWRADSCHPCQL